MIDLHSHILPRLDDGTDSVEAALEMARAAVADGVTAIAATPHVRHDYPTEPEQMEQLVASLRDALHEASIPLLVLTGGEVALDWLPELSDDDLHRFGLGGSPRYVLLEIPDLSWPLAFEQTVFDLQLRGFGVVLAHPERNYEVQQSPERLEHAVESGVLVQLTAAAVDGRYGPQSQKTCRRLLDLELAHLIASDAHGPAIRQIGMSAAAHEVGDVSLARWLTEDVPAAIVSGDELPPRPERAAARRFRWRGAER